VKDEILDEATAAIETDSIIQERLDSNMTILTCHRINTVIDYNKIVVLENDVEFDSPSTYLSK
jgi:ABC-type multidrug transport system fused ATPase/permease subunit